MKYPYLTIALLMFFGIVDIGILGNHYDLTKSDWSGWVQAIGSIAALGVAIYIMSRQNQHAARLLIDADKRALLRRADATAAVVDRATNQLQQFCELITESLAVGNENNIRSMILTSKFALQDAQGATRAIPAQELGSYKMVSGLSKVVQALATFDKWAEVSLNEALLPPAEDIQKFLTRTISNCENAKVIFFEGVDALKSE